MNGSANLRKRAMVGEPDAMYDLGTQFEARANLKRFGEWYAKAAECGSEQAVEALTNLDGGAGS